MCQNVTSLAEVIKTWKVEHKETTIFYQRLIHLQHILTIQPSLHVEYRVSHCSKHKLNSLTVIKNLDHRSNKSLFIYRHVYAPPRHSG